MRGFLVFLIFLPLMVFGGTVVWVRGSQPKQAASKVELPALGAKPDLKDPKALKGWELFNAKGCVYCHGPNGAGGVDHNNAVGGKIPALLKVYEGYSEDELKARILGGVTEVAKDKPEGPTPPLYMPAWKGNLTEAELDAIVAYLFSFKPAGGGDEW